MDLRSTARSPGGRGCAPGETTGETTVSEDGDYTLGNFMDLRLCGSIEALWSRDHEECVAGEAETVQAAGGAGLTLSRTSAAMVFPYVRPLGFALYPLPDRESRANEQDSM